MNKDFIKNKKWIAGSLLAIVVVATGVVGLTAKSAAEQVAKPIVTRPALTVKTTQLREDKWARSLTTNGSILPWQEAIISAQVQGLRIAEVNVSIGDRVRQGDVLVTLDNFVSSSEGDAERITQARVVAPDSGIISAANANVGSMSQPGAELFRLIRKGRMEWRADLTADELMSIRKGMPVEVTVGEGRLIRGTVRAISPSVNAQTRYGYALVRLANSEGLIAGAFAQGKFDMSGGKKALQTLPQSAVMQRGNATYVLLVDADKRVLERAVTVGQRIGDRIQIKQGLKPGESVVEVGGPFLTEGDFVQVVSNPHPNPLPQAGEGGNGLQNKDQIK